MAEVLSKKELTGWFELFGPGAPGFRIVLPPAWSSMLRTATGDFTPGENKQ